MTLALVLVVLPLTLPWAAAAATRASTGDAVSDGDLLVVPDGDPHAFALPAWRGRAGRVVVTTGMLRTPGPPAHRQGSARRLNHATDDIDVDQSLQVTYGEPRFTSPCRN
ncbi:hypothetical protein [Streptomyces sp. AP-93]|uniref:hypothetical protein n=1 Tax=Streptomyces sp. AP-93 TaxID=2929048 RepID=UPI0027E46DD0|nr:hypothetical protein [Streptomyces sp. AP-93]